jgi:hypothetical protein
LRWVQKSPSLQRLASAVTGFVGQMQQASAQQDAAKYQAAVARNNQIIAQQNAGYAAQAGAVQAQARDRKNASIAGSLLAGQGASGIDVESTSSKEVRDSQEQLGRLDTQTIMARALLQSRSIPRRQPTKGPKRIWQHSARAMPARLGPLAGLAPCLGGANSFADKWMKYQNVGITPFSSANNLGDWSPRGAF